MQIADILERHGIKIHPTTVGRIIKNASQWSAYSYQLPLPKLGRDWAADERYIKIEKKEHYLFEVTDTKTRFLIS